MKRLILLLLFSLAGGAHAEGGLSGKPAATRGDGFGALAYNVKTRAWAYAIKVSDKASAKAMVAKLCGPTCASYGPFEQCGVIVANGTDVGYGAGADKLTAETEALKNCGAGCQVAVWGCNPAAISEGAGFGANSTHTRNYGAIAYDANTGAFGTVWDHGSFSEAVGAARSACGRDCRIYMAQAGDCGVLAHGRNSVAVGAGNDYKAAEATALAKCGNDACKPVTWFCDSNAQ